ncbi:hypothetical protein CALCODRAFT_78797 [Calocera cornea HHB12733]|uniref:Uncharacterized protein n=1 Tax=Calocera cornea HHB12733 TaxID=1353952 RepID=A0A165DG51_9BASI|nr:hypothetical protein CALCODRAFT_78797 [Calocera cornea HHB12733]
MIICLYSDSVSISCTSGWSTLLLSTAPRYRPLPSCYLMIREGKSCPAPLARVCPMLQYDNPQAARDARAIAIRNAGPFPSPSPAFTKPHVSVHAGKCYNDTDHTDHPAYPFFISAHWHKAHGASWRCIGEGEWNALWWIRRGKLGCSRGGAVP